MLPLSAIYIRMNSLLPDLGRVSSGVLREISELRDNLDSIGISWKGTAFEAYSRRLKEDLDRMERIALGMVTFSSLLYISLTRYQETELKVADIIGGLQK